MTQRTVKGFNETVTVVGELQYTYAVKLGLMTSGIHRYGHWDLPEANAQRCFLVQEPPITTRIRPRLYVCFDEDFA